jgi:hypothetical protein
LIYPQICGEPKKLTPQKGVAQEGNEMENIRIHRAIAKLETLFLNEDVQTEPVSIQLRAISSLW